MLMSPRTARLLCTGCEFSFIFAAMLEMFSWSSCIRKVAIIEYFIEKKQKRAESKVTKKTQLSFKSNILTQIRFHFFAIVFF